MKAELSNNIKKDTSANVQAVLIKLTMLQKYQDGVHCIYIFTVEYTLQRTKQCAEINDIF